MLKFTKMILVSLLALSITSISVNANDTDDENKLTQIVKEVMLQNENTEVEIERIEDLYDINGELNYKLIVFVNGGYAITNRYGYPSEYSLKDDSVIPYGDMTVESKKIYAGPGNYYNNIIVKKNMEVNNITEKDGFNISERFQEINNEMANKKPILSSTRAANVWVQLPAERFSRYRWINTDNTCGSYATAIALAYYQDYVSTAYVPSSLRTKNSTSPGSLITTLKKYIETGYGTLPGNVANGVRSFFSAYNTGQYAQFYDWGTWDRVVDKVGNQSRPLMVGLTSIAGSPYGNHWVTVYGYMENSSGKGYYRCNDNHGNTNKSIEASWTCGSVWISN